MTPIPPSGPTAPSSRMTPTDQKLHAAAVQLEAAFLTEMLKSAGLGAPQTAFGGGAGEDQFESFLLREQAQQIAQSGGIGLAQSLFEALKERQNDG